MAKIISQRGKKPAQTKVQKPERDSRTFVIEITDFTPSPAELDHIKKVFDGIRKQLNDVEVII